jgi:hypothetical protein
VPWTLPPSSAERDYGAATSWRSAMLGSTVPPTPPQVIYAAGDHYGDALTMNGDPIGKLSDVTMTVGDKTYTFKGAAAELEELERPASWGSW